MNDLWDMYPAEPQETLPSGAETEGIFEGRLDTIN